MVSLCALQIEIADDAEPIGDIDFNCGRSIEDLLENLTMSTQLPKPVRSQSWKSTISLPSTFVNYPTIQWI